MYKLNLQRTLVIVTLFCASACSVIKPRTSSDSALNPSWAEYFVGNRAPNASFENTVGDKFENWQGVGCHVSTNEVAKSGERSLSMFGEEEGVAHCASKQFSVFPGHYEFSVWFKAKGLQLNSTRTLDKAFKVWLNFYDSHGELINKSENGYQRMPLTSAFLNISKDDVVEQSEFVQVHLRAKHYPFDYGWTPANAKTANIQLEFTAPGQVYLDDFSLTYSKWNFPLEERIFNLAKLISASLNLFPVPQSVENLNLERRLTPKGNKVCFGTEENVRELHLESEALSKVYLWLTDRGFYVGAAKTCPENSFAIFLDGERSARLFDASEQEFVKREKEGYLIKSVLRHHELVGYAILYSTFRGREYALQTLKQLLNESKSGTIVARAANIKDYPSVTLRAVSAKDPYHRGFLNVLAAGEWLVESRLNGLYFELNTEDGKWWETKRKEVKASQGLQSSELFDLGVLINPYIHRAEPSLDFELVLEDEETIKALFDSLSPYLAAGTKNVVLRLDDFVPADKTKGPFYYFLDQPRDKVQFSDLADAHWDLATRLAGKIRHSWPLTNLYLVPPWYTNYFIDESGEAGSRYLRSLTKKLPKSYSIMWTGQSVRSLKIDEFQFFRFLSYLNGRVPVLWDNSLFARRHRDYWEDKETRRHLNSFIEPFDVSIPSQALGAGVYVNVAPNELTRIQFATLGAYLWNPSSYNPEAVLWSYLLQRFGEEGAKTITNLDAVLWSNSNLEELPPHKLVSMLKQLRSLKKLKRASDEGELISEIQTKLISRMQLD